MADAVPAAKRNLFTDALLGDCLSDGSQYGPCGIHSEGHGYQRIGCDSGYYQQNRQVAAQSIEECHGVVALKYECDNHQARIASARRSSKRPSIPRIVVTSGGRGSEG
jgi:hypothetical protein